MKIQIPNYNIIETDNLNINDIPLSYIDLTYKNLKINCKINKEYLKDEKTLIRPYSKVNPDDLFFNSKYEILDNIELKRNGNEYIYEPKNIIEYTPESFSCNVLIKKNITFSNNNNYNLKISVIEDGESLERSSSLISIFADAYRRDIAPSNISINNKSLKPESLITSSLMENDIIFAHSSDGVNITNSDNELIDIDIDNLLNNHVNLWLSIDSFEDSLIPQKNIENITIYEDTSIFNIKQYPQNKKENEHYFIFDANKRHKNYSSDIYNYINFANSVLIIEKKDAGHLILTPNYVLNDLESNAKLIYEVIMYVFLRSYYLSKTAYSWITTEPIDYMSYSYNKLNINHKNININKLLLNDDYDIGNQYRIINILISNDNVKFKGLNSNGDMYFYKINNIDTPKKEGETSFLTTKQTVINYFEEDINYIETKFSISSNIIDDIAYITINPYYSSSNKIFNNNTQTFRLSDVDIEYYICTKPTSPQIESMFTFVSCSDYDLEKDGNILCYITLTTTKETRNHDIRINGGGLPKNQPNNFDLIDIGNIYGRPYRIGSTIIISLPKECEQYNDIIQKEVYKHISSGDYPIFFYE